MSSHESPASVAANGPFGLSPFPRTSHDDEEMPGVRLGNQGRRYQGHGRRQADHGLLLRLRAEGEGEPGETWPRRPSDPRSALPTSRVCRRFRRRTRPDSATGNACQPGAHLATATPVARFRISASRSDGPILYAAGASGQRPRRCASRSSHPIHLNACLAADLRLSQVRSGPGERPFWGSARCRWPQNERVKTRLARPSNAMARDAGSSRNS